MLLDTLAVGTATFPPFAIPAVPASGGGGKPPLPPATCADVGDEPERIAFVAPRDFGLGASPRSIPEGSTLRGVVGVVTSEKLPGGYAVAGSAMETAGLTRAVCDPDNVLVVPSPHVLHYRETVSRPDGTTTRVEGIHRAWAAARRRDGKIISYTFLDTLHRARSEWSLTEAAVGKAYRTLGVRHVVFTDVALAMRQKRDNLRRMLVERSGSIAHPDVVRVREALGQGTAISVERLHDRANPGKRRKVDGTLAAVIELALAGVVELDLRRPLGPATRVSRGRFA